MFRVTALTLLVAMMALAAPAQSEKTAEEAFYRGFYFETALRDFEKASAKYSKAIELATKAKKQQTLVKALVQNGIVLQKLGRHAEAKTQFEAALQRDPQNEVAKAALQEKDASQDDLGLRITALVAQLGGANHLQAFSELGMLGATAVPHLERALTSRSIGIVSKCAKLLSRAGARGAEALARGLANPQVIFPEQLVEIRIGETASLVTAAAALTHGDPAVRMRAAHDLASHQWLGSPAAENKYAAVMRGLAELEDPEPLKAVLHRGSNLPAVSWLAMSDRIIQELRSDDLERQHLALNAVRSTIQRVDMPQSFWDAAVEAASAILAKSADVRARQSAASILKEIDSPWTAKAAANAVAAARAEFTNPGDNRDASRLEPFARSKAHSAVDLDTRIALLNEACAPSSKLTHKVRSSFAQSMTRGIFADADAARRTELLHRGLKELKYAPAITAWMGHGWKLNDWDVMVRFAQNQSSEVRNLAYRWMSDRGIAPEGTATPQHLVDDLGSSDAELRKWAWAATKGFKDPALAPGIRAYVKSLAKESEKHFPLFFLSVLVGEDALPDLERALEVMTEPKLVQGVANIRGEDAVAPLMKAAKKHGSLWQVIFALENSAHEPVAKAMLEAAPDSLMDSRSLGRAATLLDREAFAKRVMAAMTSRDGRTRASACRWAGIKRMDGAWPALMTSLEDDSGDVRTAAKKAIDEIRWFHQVKAGLTNDERGAAVAKARELARSDNPAQRRGAAFALAALKDQAAIPTLLKLLEDKDASVQEAAVTALQALGGGQKK